MADSIPTPAGYGGMTDHPRRSVASFEHYTDAQRAVDRLSDAGFPVDRVQIVGRGLKYVEQVTGRLTTASAALRGIPSGAIVGALLGWLFGLFDWSDPLISGLLLALYGLLIGAVLGALFGALAHTATRGERDFSAVGAMAADRYDVLVDEEVAGKAIRLLGERPEAAAPGTGGERR
jgi:hypothetical protein